MSVQQAFTVTKSTTIFSWSVNIECLQSCNGTNPAYCQPSLFYGSSQELFPEQGEEYFIGNCRYYHYVLTMPVAAVAGQSLTCGGPESGGVRHSDPPLTITVIPSELLLA